MPNERQESLSLPEKGEILQNSGFSDAGLITFLQEHPRVHTVLERRGFVDSDGLNLQFPLPVTDEEARTDKRAADRRFRGNVGRHTVAVGATMGMLLTGLQQAGAVTLSDDEINGASEAMILHDYNKVREIRMRRILGSSDAAYDDAEAHMGGVLAQMGFSQQEVGYPASVGHNGAGDFFERPNEWPLTRQAAYLSDDLLQETVIQTDILAKAKRLQNDPKYKEANEVGFPDRLAIPPFVTAEGHLRPKFDIQEEATRDMAANVAKALGIPWENLGKYLIKQATQSGLYTAQIA